jgi:hypothetical protein
MSIHSSTFGSVRLTGEDARKFEAQVKYGRPKKIPAADMRRARAMADALVRDGFAPIKLKPKKAR